MKRQLIGELSVSGNVYADSISEYTSGAGVTVNDEVYMPGIGGTGTGVSMVYYNRSTGELTYADQPAGTSDVSVTNQGDNRVVTATAVADVLNAEEYMTFDGSTLQLLNGAELDQVGKSITLGANVPGYNARTDATVKAGYFTIPHYTNAEEPIVGIGGLGHSTQNRIDIGGGNTSYNYATDIYFYAAPNNTTTNANAVATMNINGFHTDTISELTAAAGVTINDEVYLPTIGGSGTGTSMIYYNRATGELTYGDAPAGGSMVYPTGDGIPIVVSGTSWGTTITDNSTNWDTAHGWGDHDGLYDLTGTAAGLISTHESTYNHANYDTAYDHSQLTTGNPHVVGYADITDFNTGVSTYETSHADVVVHTDFGSNGILTRSFSAVYGALTNSSSVDTVETTLTDDDTHLPTSGAVFAAIVTYTFDSGLTEAGGNVDLGGALTSDVTFSGTARNFYVGIVGASSYVSGFSALSSTFSSIYSGGSTTIGWADTVTGIPSTLKNIIFSGTAITITDTNDATGLQYDADYSTNGAILGDRWIPDKGYVDSVATGVTLGADDQIPVMNGATDFVYSANLTFNGTTLDVGTILTVDTINEHTAATGVTVEGVLHEDGWITIQENDGISFGDGSASIQEAGFNSIFLLANSSTVVVVDSEGVLKMGSGKPLVPWGDKTAGCDIGAASAYFGNAYFDRVYIDQAACYIDVTGTGATLDMTFTSTLSGTVNLNDLIGGAGSGVTAVSQGDGMEFTTISTTGNVHMGTPTTLTLSTTNLASGRTHEHALSIANFTSSTAGLVPLSGGGTTNYLRADGTWANPAGGMIYPGAGIALSTGSAWGTSITNNSENWNTAYTHSTVTTGNPHSVTAANIGNFGTSNAGCVPASGGGTANFLRADGTWAVPSGSGLWSTDTNGITYTAGNVGIGVASSATYDLAVGSGATIGGTVYMTGLGSNDTEDHVIAINDSTGLLSKRAVSSFSSGSWVFDSGLTDTSGNIDLGGALTTDFTLLGGALYNVSIGTAASPIDEFTIEADLSILIRSEFSAASYGYLEISPYDPSEINLFSLSGAEPKGFHIGSDNFTVFDVQDDKGMQYYADYSTNGASVIGNRWIPDKEYVDGISDRRLKDGIVPYTEPVIEKIQRLITYIYHLKKDPSKTLRYGLMADEVEAEFPYAIQEMDEGFQSVRYKDLVPILMQGIKELKDEFDTFKSSIKKP